jgi:hypothetical protein
MYVTGRFWPKPVAQVVKWREAACDPKQTVRNARKLGQIQVISGRYRSLNYSISSVLLSVLAFSLSGCTDKPDPFFPLQHEAEDFLVSNLDALNMLADALEVDAEIASISCSVRLGGMVGLEATLMADGARSALEGEAKERYRTLVKAAGICNGGGVLGGTILHFLQIEAPMAVTYIDFLRVDREGDALCDNPSLGMNATSCVVPVTDGWSISYHQVAKW